MNAVRDASGGEASQCQQRSMRALAAVTVAAEKACAARCKALEQAGV